VAPYAEAAGLDLEVTDDLSEEEATPDSVAAAVHQLLSGKEPVVLCTHRPVLPWVFEALALERRTLEPGAMLVVHHRAGRVLALEPHPR
jgi:8-oxo-dGTP diphosphatase